MEVFFTVGLLAVAAAGTVGFILGKRSVQVPDIEGRLQEQRNLFEQQKQMLEQQKTELQES